MPHKPDPCECASKGRTFPLGATSDWLLRVVTEEGSKAVGGKAAVDMIKAHPNAVWCTGCGGLRAEHVDVKEKEE